MEVIPCGRCMEDMVNLRITRVIFHNPVIPASAGSQVCEMRLVFCATDPVTAGSSESLRSV